MGQILVFEHGGHLFDPGVPDGPEGPGLRCQRWVQSLLAAELPNAVFDEIFAEDWGWASYIHLGPDRFFLGSSSRLVTAARGAGPTRVWQIHTDHDPSVWRRTRQRRTAGEQRIFQAIHDALGQSDRIRNLHIRFG